MIVKNEEEFLEQCLNSIKKLVEEIIIVDTGSNDKTKEIARKFTTKIFDFKWSDDFSVARNESLKYATGDWILILDADEVISESDHIKLKEILRSTSAVGLQFLHRHYTNNSAAAGWQSSDADTYTESKISLGWWQSPILRLFKNISPTPLFQGVVHESVVPSLVKKGDIINIDVPIHHFGKLNKSKLQEKEFFYERLGENKTRLSKDYFSYYELGRQYANNGKLNEAIVELQKSISLKNDFADSWFVMGTVYMSIKDLNLAENSFKMAKNFNKDDPDIYDNLGVLYAKKNNFENALNNFRIALKLNTRSARTLWNIGLLFRKFGKEEESKYYFLRAAELDPNYKNIFNKLSNRRNT
jgi:glycosyltransferase involved in cell wall biosynthesis